MATKHIKDNTWRKVEEKTVKAVIETRTNIKETEMLDFLINLGLEKMTEEDFQRIKKEVKGSNLQTMARNTMSEFHIGTISHY